jgi:hypothetical protein
MMEATRRPLLGGGCGGGWGVAPAATRDAAGSWLLPLRDEMPLRKRPVRRFCYGGAQQAGWVAGGMMAVQVSVSPGGTLATFDWDHFARRVNDVQRAVEAHNRDKAAEALPLVMNAWYHVGAAAVALELIHNIEDPDQRPVLGQLFTAPQDLLDWTAFSLGARSVVSGLDLCAAALWRLGNGEPLKGGWESDIDHAYKHRSKLASGPLVDWLVEVRDSPEYPVIKEFRDGFTHRQVNRHVRVILGQATQSVFESEVGSSRETAAARLPKATAFAVERFSAFCDAAIEQFRR